MIQLLLINSLFACVLSFHNILVRYQYALAHQGDLSPILVKIYPRYHSPYQSSVIQTCIAVMVIMICAFFALDPLTQVFGYMAGISTVGCVALMVLTSIAVYRYFSKNQQHHVSRLQTQWVALLAALLLGLCLSMILINFPTLTGGSLWVCMLLALIVPMFFLLGVFRQNQLIQKTT